MVRRKKMIFGKKKVSFQKLAKETDGTVEDLQEKALKFRRGRNARRASIQKAIDIQRRRVSGASNIEGGFVF